MATDSPAEQATSPNEPTKPATRDEESLKEIEHRERLYFLQRRYEYVEKKFLGQTPDTKEVTRPDGAKFRVLSSFCELPGHLKEKPKAEGEPYRLTIYVSGMFDATKPNYGNHPLETKLAGSLLTGDTDAIMMVKAEGLNPKAYLENDKGCVQKRVAEEDWEVVKNQINALGLEGKPVTLHIVGYSEGATQGASLAKIAAESGSVKVQEYVSIGGSGLAGSQAQEAVEPKFKNFLQRTKDFFSKNIAAQEPSQKYHDDKICRGGTFRKKSQSNTGGQRKENYNII